MAIFIFYFIVVIIIIIIGIVNSSRNSSGRFVLSVSDTPRIDLYRPRAYIKLEGRLVERIYLPHWPWPLTFDLDLPNFNHLVPCGQVYDWRSLVTIGLELTQGSCSQTAHISATPRSNRRSAVTAEQQIHQHEFFQTAPQFSQLHFQFSVSRLLHPITR